MPPREPVRLCHNNKAGLRERIRVIASGQLINPAEVAWALCVGADFINSARGFMMSLECIQALPVSSEYLPDRYYHP